MSSLLKVLVIDDDRVTHRVISNALEGISETKSVKDGDSGISMASSWQPDVVLLDVEMPGKNGYEVCDILKRQSETSQIPIIFLSGRGSLRERVLGYEAGGDDYLVKPCDDEIIQAKVQRISSIKHHHIELSEKAKTAEQAAFEAMKGSADMGTAIRFVENTYQISSFAELAEGLFTATNSLNLICCVYLVTRNEKMQFNSQGGDVAPLEAELMDMLHGGDRFYDFGCRTVISYDNVVLLVKNMPLQDHARYGRLKDVLPFIVSAVDAKVRVLETEFSLQKQSKHLSHSVDVVRNTLVALTQALYQNQDAIATVMKELMRELDYKLPTMGLDDDQERYIVTRIDEAFQKSVTHIDDCTSMRRSLDGIVRLLQHLSEEQTEMVRGILEHREKQKTTQVVNDDIELF